MKPYGKNRVLIAAVAAQVLLLFVSSLRADSLFLSRQTESKWSLTPYYVNQMAHGFNAVGAGSQVQWQFGGQMMMLQPSVRLGERINMYMTLGTGETFSKLGGGKVVDESALGGTYSYGLGMDWKIKKESDWSPLVGLKLGFGQIRTNYTSTLWYEPDGTKHTRAGSGSQVFFNTFQTGISFSKKATKNFEISVGAGHDFVISSESQAYNVITKSRKEIWEEFPDDALWIPRELLFPSPDEYQGEPHTTEYWSKMYEMRKYYWDKYPEYFEQSDLLPIGWPEDKARMADRGGAYVQITALSRFYGDVEGRLALPNEASLIMGIRIGRTLGFSLGYTVGF